MLVMDELSCVMEGTVTRICATRRIDEGRDEDLPMWQCTSQTPGLSGLKAMAR